MVTSLDTGHIHQISKVPVRIVLLVDRSGSMLTKLGKGGVHSKITKVINFPDGNKISKIVPTFTSALDVERVTKPIKQVKWTVMKQ